MPIIARAPTRIDLGGGWTDVPPYPERDGGFVCNVAIARDAVVELSTGIAAPSDALAAAALRRAGMSGMTAVVRSDVPVGSGLGGSSAAGVALQAAIADASGEHLEPGALVQRSRDVEVEELGIAGGWQDHYAAAFGGALALHFDAATRVEPISLSDRDRRAFARRCLLVHTGETRISSENIRSVLAAYEARVPAVLDALARMAGLARAMAAALRSADLDALGALVGEHWTHQRSLHPAITTPRIDELVARASAAGALGAKALGASGGGCVLIVAPNDPEGVRRAIAPLGTLLPYEVSVEGVRCVATPDGSSPLHDRPMPT